MNGLALPKPSLHCYAMSNSLPRKRLEEKELQALGLVSRSVLFYLCASGLKQLIICSQGYSVVMVLLLVLKTAPYFPSGVTPIRGLR